MEWEKPFQAHIRRLGERWVTRSNPAGAVLSASEQSLVNRKIELLQDKGAEIKKAMVHAKVVHLEEKREDKVIDYRLQTRWLISRDDQFYVEERVEDRQAVVREAHLFTDRLIKPPLLMEESHELTPVQKDDDGARHLRGPYNRLAAIRYAEQWWNRRNPAYLKVENDCTNYVSQCLHAGGIPMSGYPVRSRGWWYRRPGWSYSWAVANSLRWYLSRSGNVIGAVEVDRPEKLVPGDVICYDFEGDGHWNHNAFVTAKDTSGAPLVNAHTYDARLRDWAYLDSPAWTKNIQYKFFHILDDTSK
ncbi:hypothetical protein EWI07_08390 [Sporolactobacillus sp. THM7-4]|nr:hypothetical protein EWI07_08390 [Sporolactobacillus sp. THM7-4]